MPRKLLIWLFLVLGTAALQGQQDHVRLFPFVADGKVGFIDALGMEVLPPQYGNAGDSSRFREGLANVPLPGSGWGYVDATGRVAIAGNFWSTRPFSEGFGVVQLSGRGRGYAFVDASGKVYMEGLKVESSFHQGLAAEVIGNKWGYLSLNMQVAIPPQFDFAEEFHDGRAPVSNKGKFGYIDTQGKVIVEPKYDLTMPFSDGMGRVKVFAREEPYPKGTMGMEGQTSSDIFRWGAVDANGSEIIPPQFLDITEFSGGYALAMPDGNNKFGIIDHHGIFVVAPCFEEVRGFTESVAAVKSEGKWGYVNASGEWVIQPSFEYAEAFDDGLARAAISKGRYGYIDHSGKWVWRVDLRNPQGNGLIQGK